MLIFLLLFEIAIIFIIVLCHLMIERKYKEIERGTYIYTDKRAYRTKQSVAFVDDILKRYQQYTNAEDTDPDLYSMIKSSLLKEYIGKFTFIGVNNVANKAKYIMWGIITLELTIACINNIATSLEGIVISISSILLAIGVEIFTIVRALEEKKEATIVLVEDYILNTYPLQKNKQVTGNDVSSVELEEGPAKEHSLLAKDQKKNISAMPLSTQQEENIEKKVGNQKERIKKQLTEKDIAKFINNLS